MKDTHTVFPYGIDSRVYAQDITLNDLEIFSKYQTLLAQGKYTEASVLLNNSDAYFYGAWMLIMWQNNLLRLYPNNPTEGYVASLFELWM